MRCRDFMALIASHQLAGGPAVPGHLRVRVCGMFSQRDGVCMT